MADYTLERREHRLQVNLSGDLTAVVVPGLKLEIQTALQAGARELVFDLGRTAMLDSSGMSLLIAAANSLGRAAGRIQVTNASPDIFQLLQSMRLVSRLNVTAKPQ